MNKDLIKEVKKKKEFFLLPDSIIERSLELSKGDIKEARALLRKYFGVFLTNRVLKGSDEKILGFHLSSRERDYKEFYKKIFEDIKNVGSIIDLGCGVNGFSYNILRKFVGEVDYLGIEASETLVDKLNFYFKKGKIKGKIVNGDLFDLDNVISLIKSSKNPRIVFLFQVIDALENLKRNFSKRFLLKISKTVDKVIISLPTKSIGGKTNFFVQRKWLLDFLKENLFIEKDFNIGNERILFLPNY